MSEIIKKLFKKGKKYYGAKYIERAKHIYELPEEQCDLIDRIGGTTGYKRLFSDDFWEMSKLLSRNEWELLVKYNMMDKECLEILSYIKDNNIKAPETYFNECILSRELACDCCKLINTERCPHYPRNPTTLDRFDPKRNLKFVSYHPLCNCIVSCDNPIFIDPRDEKRYRTIKIGKQIWMTENLNYEAEGSVCYNNKPINGEKYGRLYNWETALKICPKGWHLPSQEEWQTLVDFAGGKEIAGKKLKAKNSWNKDKDGKNGNGTDEFGFAALPSGCGYSADNFDYAGNFCHWWCASEEDARYAYYWFLSHNEDLAKWHYSDKDCLQSVRCVRD
jgi:uncharacterized protein (TIGR02145 family)